MMFRRKYLVHREIHLIGASTSVVVSSEDSGDDIEILSDIGASLFKFLKKENE